VPTTIRGDLTPIPARGRVHVDLWGDQRPATGFVNGQQITGSYQTALLPDGSWTVAVDHGNTAITPAGTAYRIAYLDGTETLSAFYVTVPITGGPYDVEDILTSAPAAITDPALATHIVSNLHIPIGGTTGQVLAKTTATDRDVSWQTGIGGPPTGTAGGVLSGTYPNPGFAADMASQVELDTAVGLRVAKAGDTMTGELALPDLSISGLTGAVQPSRYVGATASGSPTTGTFTQGDVILGRGDATFWLCTASGTPGTWTRIGSERILAHVESDATQSGITTITDVTAMVLTDFVITNSALVFGELQFTAASAVPTAGLVTLTDGANTVIANGGMFWNNTVEVGPQRVSERITTPGTYTRKLRVQRTSGTGTMTIGGGTGTKWWNRLYVLGT
jgi:hypothetical protein